jgi:hypothetical protein
LAFASGIRPGRKHLPPIYATVLRAPYAQRLYDPRMSVVNKLKVNC